MHLLFVLLGVGEKARERSRLQDEKRGALKMHFLREDSSTWMKYFLDYFKGLGGIMEQLCAWQSKIMGLNTTPPLTSCMARDT